MVRIIRHEKDNLNVWADFETDTQVYCDDVEMFHLFLLKGVEYAKTYPDRLLNEAHMKDFMSTANRLNDFQFEFTDDGIVYYTPKI